MTRDGPRAARRAAELRREFDRAFAHPPLARIEEAESFLAVRLGGQPYAVRLTEVAEIFKDREVVRMPGPRSEFLGLAGLRGGIVPVYSLPILLGYPPSSAPARWLLLAAPDRSVAFAVEEFEGHLRVDRAEITPATGNAMTARLGEHAYVAEGTRPIISLSSFTEVFKQRAGVNRT